MSNLELTAGPQRGAPSLVSGIVAVADAVPAHRDRVVDLVRAACIVVVVVWHWVFSVTQWRDDALSMPNPIGQTSGLWLLTWVFQVMPLFFVVGGFSNLAGWGSARAAGWSRGDVRFVGNRLRRLGAPAAALAAVWIVIDGVVRVLRPGTPSVVSWAWVVFVPLWFLAVYAVVTALVPVTGRLHGRAPLSTLVALALAVAFGDVARFAGGAADAGFVTTGAVWLFAHQLGYFWRDGSLTMLGVGGRGAVAALGLAGLVVTTNTGVYPRSAVAVDGELISNMYPTTAPIALLAVFQLGLLLLLRPVLARWIERSRSAWRATVVVNAFAMTVFCWHMTALVAAIGLWHFVGFELCTEATRGWWLQRPIWLCLPAMLLVPLVLLFWPVEHRRRER